MNYLLNNQVAPAVKVLLLVSVFLLAPIQHIPVILVSQAGATSSTSNLNFQQLPPGSTPALVESLLKNLPEEYQLQVHDNGFFMANPAHGLQINFDPKGIHFKSDDMQWSMAVSGIGSSGSIRPVHNVMPRNDADKILYEYGIFSEWYMNSPWGIEQGFTLHSSPGGKQENSIVVELTLSGNLQPILNDDTLTLSDAHGNTIFRYSKLIVFDADNKILPAHLTLNDKTLRINVASKDARYPVTIDPFVQKAEISASDGKQGDWFGMSVAISGNTIVIGARGDDNYTGSAYVFTKPVSGWAGMTQTAKLTASDRAGHDLFGESVAISGDTIVIGARGDDNYTGSAYVFTKPVTGWADMTQTAKLTASDRAVGDWFGMSVGIEGETVVVGATNDNLNIGAAYVFTKPVGGWADITQTAKLTASDGTQDPDVGLGGGDQFGYSVAISHDTIVVGALLDDADQLDSGSAYVFTKPVSGWADMTETAKLTASDYNTFDYFGSTVAVDNETIVVGAYGQDGQTGAVYVFTKPSIGWKDMTQTAKLTAREGAAGDTFGYSLAINDNIIMVGVLIGEKNSFPYIYQKPGNIWKDMTETIKLSYGDNAPGDYFGSAVAMSDNLMVIGAYGKNSKTGAAYIFANKINEDFCWPIFLPVITNIPRQ